MFTGCHSYFVIPKADYTKISTMEDIKIVHTNGREFIVEKNDSTNVQIAGDSLVISEGTQKKIILMDDVGKLKENRFDLGGTITLSLVGLTIVVIFILFDVSF
ncbi:MAG: hypothetical protein M5T52_09210 [Ignavibacteriaceae bacterium]|nr:hypothetical protein [Ignavibacteriaceae bacterium]